MARWLRQSTSADVPIGPFVDQSDGFTAESGLTLTQPDIRLKKNGGAWAQKNAAQTLSHEENGYYEVTLDATDTNTLGLLRLAVNETGALPVFEDFLVVPANVWDSFFSTDLLQVDLTQWLGVAPLGLSSQLVRVIVQDTGAGAISTGSFAAGAINAAAIAADAITAAKVADGTIDAATFAAGAINAAAIAAGAIDNDALAADMDSYTTRSWIGRQGTTADKYIVQWFKNGQLISTGITVPLISVFDDAGTDLIAETAMTEIGSRQCFKFIEATNTLTPGEVYIMQVKATIDGAVRIDRQPITRDSA